MPQVLGMARKPTIDLTLRESSRLCDFHTGCEAYLFLAVSLALGAPGGIFFPAPSIGRFY